MCCLQTRAVFKHALAAFIACSAQDMHHEVLPARPLPMERRLAPVLK